jgi:hypothetical protein
MQPLIFFTLMLYIPPYHLFIPMLSNGTSKITITPKLLLHLWAFFENLPCLDIFQHRHYFSHTNRLALTGPRNGHDHYQCLFPKTLVDISSLPPSRHPSALHQFSDQSLLSCILQERPNDTLAR